MSKTIPFTATLLIRDTCLCLHAQRAARGLARRFDEAFRPVGLTNGQFSLLMSLNRPEPPSMGPVADLLGMERTTLTAMLKPLLRRGLVTVSADTRDRRNRLVALTDAGRTALDAALPTWRALHAAIEAELTSVEPDALRHALRTLG